MVTAELAVATLAAGAVLIMLSWGIFALTLQLRCVDTASAVARQWARNDGTAARAAAAAAPQGAVIAIDRSPSMVAVDVGLRLGLFEFAHLGRGPVRLHAHAEVVPEPKAGE